MPYRGFVFEGCEGRDSAPEGSTITGGPTLPGAVADLFNGVGILVQASSPTIRDCTFTGNQAGYWSGACTSATPTR